MTDYRRPLHHTTTELDELHALKFIPVWRDEQDSWHRYVVVGGHAFECSVHAKESDNHFIDPQWPLIAGVKVWDYALDMHHKWYIDYIKEHGEHPRGISVYKMVDGTDYGYFEHQMLWTEVWERVDRKIAEAIAAYFVTGNLEEFYTK